MGALIRYAVCASLIILSPVAGFAESWVEFHTENYNYRSEKLRKKLNFKSHSYYDADSLKRSSSGDVDVWVKEVSTNDSYYVGKGTPSSESIIKKIHLWCRAGKYEIVTADVEDVGESEETGEAVKPGSLYDELVKAVCSKKSQKM